MSGGPNDSRGGSPDVKNKPVKEQPGRNARERQLEEGLEESMAGSDPPSVTQPAPKAPERKSDNKADDKAGKTGG